MSEPQPPPRRLLVLDDDPDVGRTVAIMARGLNYECQVTDSPDAFFALLETWQPSHILLDLMMPEMDGVEVIRHLARLKCEAALIISSGLGSRVVDAARRAADQHRLNIAGALAKPFSVRQLRRLLDQEGRAPRRDRHRRPDTVAVTDDMLAEGLRANHLGLVYQPKVSCGPRPTLAGFEALARWHHPELGLITPDRFIPLAERNGLIEPLTRRVLRMACTRMAALLRQHGERARHWSMAVNLSARCLNHFEMADKLMELCDLHGLAPHNLTLELTETAAMEDGVLALDLLTRLRMKGFNLAIDDFGVGYSSMVQLAQLPFSELKLDKAFVGAANHSQEARAIIKSAVELGHELGLKVVGEGVEDADTQAFLSDIGCDFMQGYLIARPMEGERVVEWAAESER